jgi:hypothetical protein
MMGKVSGQGSKIEDKEWSRRGESLGRMVCETEPSEDGPRTQLAGFD